MEIAILLWISALLLVAAGIAGLVLPAMPGAPLLFAGLFVAAWAEDFEFVGWLTLSFLGFLAVLTYAADFAAGALGAKRFGASGRAVAGAAVGAIVGIFFGIVGVLIGPFIGAVAGELSNRSDLSAAGRAGIGATVGLALGIAAKLSLALSMLCIFLVVRFL